MITKRLFDLVFAGLGLLFLAPLFLLIALMIKIDTAGPVFFRQERVGRFGIPFKIHKFRTMCVNVETNGLQLTAGNDSRITRAGQWLRKYKLDELAQLIDVVQGKMSLVGPRPEVPRFVAQYRADVRDVVLSVRPGITDRASIEYRDESSLLGQSNNPEATYIQEILPIKLKYYVNYVNGRSLFGDVEIIFKTLGALLPHFVPTGLFWICAVAVALLSVLPGEDIPGVFVFWDKAQHSLAFLVLALLGCWAYPGRVLNLFLGLLMFGAGIEVGQSFLSWRNGDVFDFVADALGVLVVVVLQTRISPASKLFWQRR